MLEHLHSFLARTIVVIVALVVVSFEIVVKAFAFVLCLALYIICALFSPVLNILESFECVGDFIKWGLSPKMSWTSKAIKLYNKSLGC